jgi:3'(2'), 5'-bisphosphate nucleotidase
MSHLLSEIVSLANRAGDCILSDYHSEIVVEYKANDSPVTAADLAAHHCLVQGLQKLTPNIPVISEESLPSQIEPFYPSRYWLVDPLDGTKEYMAKNGEFTVNIALIEDHQPVLGVVAAPAWRTVYFAERAQGAFKQIQNESPQRLQTRSWSEKAALTILRSRHHDHPELMVFCHQFPAFNLIRCGSSLKFCWLAEGLADLYPRLGPTCEWDTAAGQCILEVAGGAVLDRHNQPLHYNKSHSIKQPAFLAVADKNHAWNYLFH